jgi:hypothetical protein
VLLKKTVRDLAVYIGAGCLLVVLIVVCTMYLPSAMQFASRWVIFASVTAFVFGYQLRDFWRRRLTLRFWLPFAVLFSFHVALWVLYLHPHFGGDPRLVTGFAVTFVEYVLVSAAMRAALRKED